MTKETGKEQGRDQAMPPGADQADEGTFRRIGEILAEAAKDRPRHPITRGIE